MTNSTVLSRICIVKMMTIYKYLHFVLYSVHNYGIMQKKVGIILASVTKEAFANALKQLMTVKPIGKITVKELVEICGVNRQTFYYHFDDVYDLLEWVFEEDANLVLPREVLYDHWKDDVLTFFTYLYDNKTFALNVYNSNSRLYMLRFLKKKLESCIRSFAIIVSEERNVGHSDFEFVVEFYANCVVGIISQWMDMNMTLPPNVTKDRLLRVLDNSIENIISRFQNEK